MAGFRRFPRPLSWHMMRRPRAPILEILRQTEVMAGGLPVNQHTLLPSEIAPDQVHEVLGRHVLADGFRLVYDTRASRGSWVVDARSGEKYLGLYTVFAHPARAGRRPGLHGRASRGGGE